MFIVGIYLLLIRGLLILSFLRNFSVVILRIKLFNLGFYGDLEIVFNIWRLLFLLIVVLISRRVIIFSFSYIRGYSVRNFVFLYLRFIVSILWLVLSNNFYWIIFGWDGLGVVSFLLIVFYINHERINNGLFTLFQNRVGDLFFVFFIVGVIDISMWRNLTLKWGLLFLIIGACVKSAQFPFNSWLLAAIRAPTPISSLVHSSTLVVAGVYILLQYRYCVYDILDILKYIRILSLVIRRFGLLNEFDIKKLIAYSTIRHVSLMIYLYRFKLYKIVYFHLNIHAMFKSLIFMCFGFVILSSFHRQDKRLVTLVNLNPIIKLIYYFSCLCLAGLPFLRGFFSKDFIIEKFIENRLELSFIFLLLLFLRIRIYYRVKLIKLTNVIFSYSLIEKSFLGIRRVIIISLVIIFFINVYIRLVFRLSLELFSFKIFIYILIFGFFILRIWTNLNFKINVYDKIKNFKEIWSLNVYSLDQFVYWNMFVFLSNISVISNIKLFLLINWWVIIIFIVIFYSVSSVSVVLKKLRFLLYFLRCIAYIIFVNKVLDQDCYCRFSKSKIIL